MLLPVEGSGREEGEGEEEREDTRESQAAAIATHKHMATLTSV